MGACLPNLKFVSLVILELLAFNAQILILTPNERVLSYQVPDISSFTDTTVVNAIFGHFDICIPFDSSLHRASNDAIIFVVLLINI